MHESANIILAHWHYFNCSTDLETLDEKARGKSPLKELSFDQFKTVRELWVKMRLWKAGPSQCADRESLTRQIVETRLLTPTCCSY